MGISGSFDLFINDSLYKKHPIPVVKRYSGGGTVVVDSSTCFVSFICNQKDTCLGRSDLIHAYMEKLYRLLFSSPSFSLQENDYVLEERKFGGNAQYVTKDRWVHHTTFLWDFSQEMMDYLKLPQKRPDYRKSRSHEEFLTTMKTLFESSEEFFLRLSQKVEETFTLKKISLGEAKKLLLQEHRKSTSLL